VFVRRLMSQAIAVAEEWVPPGLSRSDRMKWERLTDEQKRIVKRVYDVFRDYAKRLEHRVLLEKNYPDEDKALSDRIGASCQIYFGIVESPPDLIDSAKGEYEVGGTKTRFSLTVTHNESERIGVRCFIGKDKDGRDTTVEAEVPVELVRYTLYVHGDHSAGVQDAIWVARVRRREPTISFW